MDELSRVRALAATETGLCVVSMAREDGTSHATVVNGGVLRHPLTGDHVVGFVVRGGARKLQHLRREGRCAITFRRSWDWAGVEGPAVIQDLPDGTEDPGAISWSVFLMILA